MLLRMYNTSDCEFLAELFYQTVHNVNAKDYTKEQLDVWATGNVNLNEWDKSFLAHFTIVAIKNEIIVGFGDIDKTGYLDRLFVHKDYQRQGIASAICDELEQRVNANKIITHASITAKTFFEQRGYRVIKGQQVIKNGISLTNYVMEKQKNLIYVNGRE
ncbi:GNAT family N-acetyltransferase [Velocimicrobium porci]|nr:GNAT family N-acetyltransferase [Velocimicrobium porci]